MINLVKSNEHRESILYWQGLPLPLCENRIDLKQLHTNPLIVIFAIEISIHWALKWWKLLFLDSSWRNKNNNNVPLTLLMVQNDFGSGMPVAAMISSELTVAVLTRFIQ